MDGQRSVVEYNHLKNEMVKALKIILKQDRSRGMILCVLLVCMTKSVYQCLVTQVVALGYQFQVRHLNIHFNRLFTQSNLLKIGSNSLMKIIRTES